MYLIIRQIAAGFIGATVIQMTSSINGYRFWQIVAG
jgi:hypothetical protein